jgi:hypothetical protein
MRKYAQYAAAVASILFVFAIILWANRSAADLCRTSELPYFGLCDQIAKQFTVG